MLGAIIGDIIGSRFERYNYLATDFELFTEESRLTDDTVCTVAVAEWCLSGRKEDLVAIMQRWGQKYPNAGYGGTFIYWLHTPNPQPYNSWGNGSAMRVSPIGWLFDNLADTLAYAAKSAEITHNHPEGIKGAQAVAAAIFLARTGQDKRFIQQFIEREFGYNLSQTCDEIRANYTFDVSCQGSVPQAIMAFLESTDFESAIRLAISLGGDSDTIAAITGSIAQAYYNDISESIIASVWERLPAEMQQIVVEFEQLKRESTR